MWKLHHVQRDLLFEVRAVCGDSNVTHLPLVANHVYLIYYSSTRQAGLDVDTAATLNLVMYAIGFVGTLSSWFIMQIAGRRTM